MIVKGNNSSPWMMIIILDRWNMDYKDSSGFCFEKKKRDENELRITYVLTKVC